MRYADEKKCTQNDPPYVQSLGMAALGEMC